MSGGSGKGRAVGIEVLEKKRIGLKEPECDIWRGWVLRNHHLSLSPRGRLQFFAQSRPVNFHSAMLRLDVDDFKRRTADSFDSLMGVYV